MISFLAALQLKIATTKPYYSNERTQSLDGVCNKQHKTEMKEQDRGEADRSLVSPGGGGQDQEARHQVSAGLQRPERSGQLTDKSHLSLV